MNDERCPDDLDSLLRWTLRDLVPEREPRRRIWSAIRAQIWAARELRRTRRWEPQRSPGSSRRVVVTRRPYPEENDALIHLWVLVKI